MRRILPSSDSRGGAGAASASVASSNRSRSNSQLLGGGCTVDGLLAGGLLTRSPQCGHAARLFGTTTRQLEHRMASAIVRTVTAKSAHGRGDAAGQGAGVSSALKLEPLFVASGSGVS